MAGKSTTQYFKFRKNVNFYRRERVKNFAPENGAESANRAWALFFKCVINSSLSSSGMLKYFIRATPTAAPKIIAPIVFAFDITFVLIFRR